jgi:hypothetical protein
VGIECSICARGEVAVLMAPLSLLATPCCLVPQDSSYTILVFLPWTPTVTRAGRRREGQEGSGIAHHRDRMNRRQKICIAANSTSSLMLLSATPIHLAILCVLVIAAMVPQCSTHHPMITACQVTSCFGAKLSVTLGYHIPGHSLPSG